MPFALAVIGIILVVAGARGTASYRELATLLRGDFTGERNFFTWVIAFGVIGAVGYIRALQPLSRALMALVLIAMFVKGGQNSRGDRAGFFQAFSDALRSSPAATTSSGDGAAPADGASSAPAAGSGLSSTSPIERGVTAATGNAAVGGLFNPDGFFRQYVIGF